MPTAAGVDTAQRMRQLCAEYVVHQGRFHEAQDRRAAAETEASRVAAKLRHLEEQAATLQERLDAAREERHRRARLPPTVPVEVLDVPAMEAREAREAAEAASARANAKNEEAAALEAESVRAEASAALLEKVAASQREAAAAATSRLGGQRQRLSRTQDTAIGLAKDNEELRRRLAEAQRRAVLAEQHAKSVDGIRAEASRRVRRQTDALPVAAAAQAQAEADVHLQVAAIREHEREVADLAADRRAIQALAASRARVHSLSIDALSADPLPSGAAGASDGSKPSTTTSAGTRRAHRSGDGQGSSTSQGTNQHPVPSRGAALGPVARVSGAPTGRDDGPPRLMDAAAVPPRTRVGGTSTVSGDRRSAGSSTQRYSSAGAGVIMRDPRTGAEVFIPMDPSYSQDDLEASRPSSAAMGPEGEGANHHQAAVAGAGAGAGSLPEGPAVGRVQQLQDRNVLLLRQVVQSVEALADIATGSGQSSLNVTSE